MKRTYVFASAVPALLLMLALASSAQTVNCSGVTAWTTGIQVTAGELVTFNNQEYKTLQSHTTEPGWQPPNVAALFSLVGTCASGTPTPTPTATATATATPTVKPTATPTATAKPTATPTATVKPTATPTATAKPTATATPTATVKPTATPTATATATPNGTACWTTWVSTTAYNGGAQVSYNGENYQAAYWTQNNNPATSSGPAGSGQPWIPEGACGVVVATPTPTATPFNTDYRVQVYVDSNQGNVNLPAATQNWTLQYEFQVPPLPTTSTWNASTQTIYQWGDVDFDSYGSSGTNPISAYFINQIVPQLILGNVTSVSGPGYVATGSIQNSWAIQAQYFWQLGSAAYAQVGSIISVKPGDQITTTISYTAANGVIVASIADNNISGPAGVSSITIDRPFLDNPSLFSSWTDFFNQAEAATQTQFIISHPVLNVETYQIDQNTMCGLLPFNISSISIPGVTATPSIFAIEPVDGLTCSQSLATLNF